MASSQQLAANRANAQLSSGPTSSEGKAKVSHNALKTGLTGRTVLLPSDDVAAYQAQVARIFQQFAPASNEEKRLTQSLADTLWRLDRIPRSRPESTPSAAASSRPNSPMKRTKPSARP